MRELIETGRRYTYWDFIRIPFRIAPLHFAAKGIRYLLDAFLPSLQALTTAAFIDTALAIFGGTAARSAIYWPLTGIMLIVAYSYLSSQIVSYIDTLADMRLQRAYRSAVMEKRARLAYRYIEDNDTWDLINRACGNPTGILVGGFNAVTGSVGIFIKVGSLLMLLAAQVWWAGLVITAVCLPLLLLAFKGGKVTYEAEKESQKYERRAGYLQGVLQGRDSVEERTMFGYSDAVIEKWYDKFEIARKIKNRAEFRYFVRMKSASLLTILLDLVIVAVLLLPLSRGELSPGMFMGLVTATLRLVQMMSWNLSYYVKEMAFYQERLKDLTAFCALEETEGALDLPADPPLSFESIEFRHVSFRYPGTETAILKDFSLRLEKGLHYAFVGVNGAGKTTVTKLLTGLYDNFEGDILINGRSIRLYTQAELKSLFSVVYQDYAKYAIPMEDNIALGNVRRRDADAIHAAAAAIELDKAIEKLPDGMQTPLGKIIEGGVDLSGGEWQRVAIARALYSPAPIRILDEPTAALDPVAESGIYELFGRISAGKSTIFITHRLGAARLADQIVVIDDGAVCELGTHQQLLKQGGIYAEMFEAQRSWYQ